MTLDFERYLLPTDSPNRSSSYAEESREFRELISFAPGFPVPKESGFYLTLPIQYQRTRQKVSSLSSPIFSRSCSQSDLLTSSVLCSNVLTNKTSFRTSSSRKTDVPRSASFPIDKAQQIQINSYNTINASSEVSRRIRPSIKQSASQKYRRRGSVRFADDCGENLVTFIMIPSSEISAKKPVIDVSSTHSENSLSCYENSRAVDFYQKLGPRGNSKQPKSDLNNNNHNTKNANVSSPQPVYRCDLAFSQPAACFSAFHQKLDSLNVALENARVSDDVQSSLTCTIKVKNLSLEKRVFARCTHDNWSSYTDLDAEYVSSGYESSLYDTFSFCISRPACAPDSSSSTVEFALCYRVAGQEFWDNNGNKNFAVSWSKVVPST